MRSRYSMMVGAALLLFATACGGEQGGEIGGSEGSGETGGERGLTILAAASLTEVFESLKEPYAVLHPSIEVTFSFESSATLVEQVKQGVEADAIATADEETMGELQSAELLDEPPDIFALNSLAIVVEAGNPQNVQGLEDLAREDLKVVMAAPEVPAGKYAQQALTEAGVEVQPVSLEEDVKAVVSKVSLGEVDAGIVYVSDARAAGDSVTTVEIPKEQNVVARYPIGVVRDAPNERHADHFIDLLLSEDGREALTEAGFSVP